jgi:hypothetical protein
MGQYDINLPGSRKATVISKKKFSGAGSIMPSFLYKKNLIGYIVKIDPSYKDRTEFRVFRTKEGFWLDVGENEITFAIKIAIEEYEITKGKDSYKELF